MGVGRLLIGEGQGAAQVFQGDSGIQNFANILAQQKAQRQQEQAELAKNLAQAKPEGLRNDADRQDFYKQYDALKNQAIAAENEPDRFKKAMALANVKQGILNLNDFANRSKDRGNIEKQFSQRLWDNNFRNQYSDDAVKQHLGSMNLGLNDPNLVNYDSLQRQIDHNKVDDDIDAMKKATLNEIPFEDFKSGGRIALGNKTGTKYYQQKSYGAQDWAKDLANHYDITPNFQQSLAQRFPIQGATPQETKQLRLQAYLKQRGETGGLMQQGDSNIEWDRKEPVTNVYMGAQQPINYNLPIVNEEGKQLGSVNTPNYLPLKTGGSVNMAGAPSINLQTGRPEQPLASSNKYNIVGKLSAPVLNKDLNLDHKDSKTGKVVSTETLPKGSLAQKEYADQHPEDVDWKDFYHTQEYVPDENDNTKTVKKDHLTPAEMMPQSALSSKALRQQLQGWQSHRGQANQTATPVSTGSDFSSFFKKKK